MGRFPFALVKKSLSLQPAPPVPEGMVPAGVLAPLFCLEKEPHLLFTKRTMMVKDHRGQISFPGGVQDAFDADLMVTALRETQEEIGLFRKLVGELREEVADEEADRIQFLLQPVGGGLVGLGLLVRRRWRK